MGWEERGDQTGWGRKVRRAKEGLDGEVGDCGVPGEGCRPAREDVMACALVADLIDGEEDDRGGQKHRTAREDDEEDRLCRLVSTASACGEHGKHGTRTATCQQSEQHMHMDMCM